MAEKKETNHDSPQEKEMPKCGIVMPISPIDGCSMDHWKDVLQILKKSITNAGFTPHLVSDANDSGIIQKRIIQNLYNNPIVVCDVSGKNPNVMFELGLRLAFDKPTIIIKDNKTDYSFDTATIEHIDYPRDLRYHQIIQFGKKLGEKIKGTYDKSQEDPNYTTFLKHFGEYKVAEMSKMEISSEKFFQNMSEELKKEMHQLRYTIREITRTSHMSRPSTMKKVIKGHVDSYCEMRGLIDVDLALNQDEYESCYEAISKIRDVQKYFESEEDFADYFQKLIKPF